MHLNVDRIVNRRRRATRLCSPLFKLARGERYRLHGANKKSACLACASEVDDTAPPRDVIIARDDAPIREFVGRGDLRR